MGCNVSTEALKERLKQIKEGGASPLKKVKDPKGTKTFDIVPPKGKVMELHRITLYETLDAQQNDGTYRFNGIEVQWADRKTGALTGKELVGVDAGACRIREFGELDFVSEIVIGEKTHNDMTYISYLGIEPYIAAPTGAGHLTMPLNILKSTNTTDLEVVSGFRIRQHTASKIFLNVEVVWTKISPNKVNKLVTEEAPFFKSVKQLNTDIYNRQKIYTYKDPESRYEDFSALITKGKMENEYLGGLPIRFISSDEKVRFDNLKNELSLQPLLEFLRSKGNINRVKLDAGLEDKVVAFCVKVLSEELLDKSKASIAENIRFVVKMLTIVYTEDEGIWKKIQQQLKAKYKAIGETLFDEAMNQIQTDAKVADIQKIENSEDEQVKKLYQLACPQKVDDGSTEDVEQLAKKYMLDAAQFLLEFHSVFRAKFGKSYHGAPVKGLERIKAKCKEYQETKNLKVSESLARIMDYVRGTIECNNGKEVLDAFKKIGTINKKDFKIVRVKNGFKEMDKKGYKSILCNIMIFDSLICELQITFDGMKAGNEINHFIYEVEREASLYSLVAKNLSLSTAFKEWLEPLIPQEMKVIYPTQQMKWKGFWVEKDTRCHMLIWLKLESNGNVTGRGGDQNGNFTITGKHKKFETIELTKTCTVQGAYGAPPQTYSVSYKGKFLDKSTIEGEYSVSMNSGFFRLWVHDLQCPGLSPSLLAYQDLNRDSKVVRRRNLPTSTMKWTGFCVDKGKNLKMELDMAIKRDGGMMGTGKDPKGSVILDGGHDNYETFGMNKSTKEKYPKIVYLDGYFTDDITLEGKYDDAGHMGRFVLNLSDEATAAKYKKGGRGNGNEATRWELLVCKQDGTRELSQVELNVANDGTISGKGCNLIATFTVTGKQNANKMIKFVKSQNNADGIVETLDCEGQFVTDSLVEGIFKTPTGYGRFKLASL